MTQLSKKQRKRTSDIHHRSIVIDALALKCSMFESKYFNQIREGRVTAENIIVAGNGQLH